MRPSVLVMTAALLLVSTAVQAAVTATPDRRSAGVKEAFYIIVRAEGTRIGEPVLPHADGLVIQRRPVSTRQQTSVNFINGRVQQNNVREWHYEAWGTQKGDLEVPPIKVVIDGQEEFSKPFTMQISDTPAVQQPTPGARPQLRPEPPSRPQPAQESRPPVGVDDLLILKCEVSSSEVYEGEAVNLVVTFARLEDPGVIVRGDQGNSIVLPTVEGFYESEIKRDERVETINGYPYVVTTFSRPMFATRPGDAVLPSVTWTGRVTAPSSLGPRSYRIERVTEPITIKVKPLPPRPPEFSGAVGRFNVSAELEPGEVEQGEPKVFTVTIAGSGNVDAIAKPTLPPMDWCHVGEPEASVSALAGPLEFEKKFAYTLTPVQGDRQVIPELKFTYFAPDIGSYKTLATRPIEVDVKIAKDEGQLVAVGGSNAQARSTVEVLNTDIEPLLPAEGSLAPAGSHLPLNTIGFGAPPLVFLAGLLWIRRSRRLATDVGYARGLRARTRSEKLLKAAASSKDPGEALFKALTGFVGDKLNLADAGLTSQDVRDVMVKGGFGDSLVEEYVKVLRTCERYRYAGQAMTPVEVAALTESAYSALDHLERETRGGRKKA
ncbi:MAG: hypothetical protein RLZZ303_1371 [Candidatus Hydrogenedentota bacterium]